MMHSLAFTESRRAHRHYIMETGQAKAAAAPAPRLTPPGMRRKPEPPAVPEGSYAVTVTRWALPRLNAGKVLERTFVIEADSLDEAVREARRRTAEIVLT